jgi:DNA-binding response OmpR family regulator
LIFRLVASVELETPMTTIAGERFPARKVTTLFVSSLDSDHAALKNIFSRSNWNAYSAFTCKEAVALLDCESIPVVICDRDLPDGDWRLLLEKTGNMATPPRVIVSSREVNERLWADVLQMGGYDLLAMPWNAREVLRVIALAWRSWEFANRAADWTPRRLPVASVTGSTRSPVAEAIAAGAIAG